MPTKQEIEDKIKSTNLTVSNIMTTSQILVDEIEDLDRSEYWNGDVKRYAKMLRKAILTRNDDLFKKFPKKLVDTFNKNLEVNTDLYSEIMKLPVEERYDMLLTIRNHNKKG